MSMIWTLKKRRLFTTLITPRTTSIHPSTRSARNHTSVSVKTCGQVTHPTIRLSPTAYTRMPMCWTMRCNSFSLLSPPNSVQRETPTCSHPCLRSCRRSRHPRCPFRPRHPPLPPCPCSLPITMTVILLHEVPIALHPRSQCLLTSSSTRI